MMHETYVKDFIMKGKRPDGRGFEEYRNIDVQTGVINKAEGSARVRIGETEVLAGVKTNIGTPFADSPGEGVLIVNAEFTPMASPDFEAGPPSEDSVELARVVDRGIRESHSIDMVKLGINEEKVWSVFVDIHIINHQGNLLDAAALAAIAALKSAKIPKTDGVKVSRGDFEKGMPMVYTPINVTVCKIGDKIILDPTFPEEEMVDAKLSISVRDDDSVCALQKQGPAGLTVEEVEKMIDIAINKSKELRKLVV